MEVESHQLITPRWLTKATNEDARVAAGMHADSATATYGMDMRPSGVPPIKTEWVHLEPDDNRRADFWPGTNSEQISGWARSLHSVTRVVTECLAA